MVLAYMLINQGMAGFPKPMINPIPSHVELSGREKHGFDST